MNAYIYFAGRERTFPSIQPEHRTWFAHAWYRLQSRNLPSSVMDSLLNPVVSALSSCEYAGQQVQDSFDRKLQAVHTSWADEFSDFFAFAFVYAGLYQGLWIHILGPAIEQKSIFMHMDVGLNLLFSTILVYFIFKEILLVLSSDKKGWQRWLWLSAGGIVYLAGLYLARFLPSGAAVPVWIVVAVSGVMALAAHIWLMGRFELGKYRKSA